jgi:hypothetical protein
MVVAEVPSESGTLMAVVVKRGEQFRFGIRSRSGTLAIVEQDFVPRGYHEPLISLKWKEADRKVEVTIDHDFGDGILSFTFDTRSYSFAQQP